MEIAFKGDETEFDKFIAKYLNKKSDKLAASVNDSPELVELGDFYQDALKNFYNIKFLDLSRFDFSHVEDSYNMFKGWAYLTDLKFGKSMKKSLNFRHCPLTHESALSVIDGLAKVEEQQVLTFSKKTYDTLSLEDIKKAIDKNWMIVNNDSPDMNDFDISKITDMTNFFSDRVDLKTLILNKWEGSNVIKMNRMFNGCRNLQSLDISSFCLLSAKEADNMFSGCKSLTDLKFGFCLSIPLDLHDCPLSHKSILSVINGLFNNSYEKFNQDITLLVSNKTYNTLTVADFKLAADKKCLIKK